MNVLYKYCNLPKIEFILERGELTLSRIDQLNDAFELSMDFSEVGAAERNEFLSGAKETWRGLRLADRLWPSTDPWNREHYDEEVSDEMWKWVGDALTFASSARAVANVGVLSLSRKRCDVLMWSHYCESWKGFVLGFSADEPAIVESGLAGLQGALGVRYRDGWVPAGQPRSQERLEALALTKAECWNYEEEARCLREIQNGGVRTLVPFQPSSLVEIVLGPRMPLDQIERCLRLRNERYPNASLLVAAPSIDGLGVTVCPLPPISLVRMALSPLDEIGSPWLHNEV